MNDRAPSRPSALFPLLIALVLSLAHVPDASAVTRYELRAGPTAFLGLSGSGKTTLAKREIARLGVERVLVFDPRGARAWDGVPAITDRAQAMLFFKRSSVGSWTRTVRSADRSLYEWLAASVHHWRRTLWVIDDANALLELPGVLGPATDVAIGGRHMGERHGVELWAITHRPHMLPIAVRSQLTRIHCFRQTSPYDLAYLRAHCGEPFAARVRALGQHQHATWDEGGE